MIETMTSKNRVVNVATMTLVLSPDGFLLLSSVFEKYYKSTLLILKFRNFHSIKYFDFCILIYGGLNKINNSEQICICWNKNHTSLWRFCYRIKDFHQTSNFIVTGSLRAITLVLTFMAIIRYRLWTIDSVKSSITFLEQNILII